MLNRKLTLIYIENFVVPSVEEGGLDSSPSPPSLFTEII